MAAGGVVDDGGGLDPAQAQAIQAFYQKYLSRTASNSEIQGWLQTGLDLNAIESQIQQSPEAQGQHYGNGGPPPASVPPPGSDLFPGGTVGGNQYGGYSGGGGGAPVPTNRTDPAQLAAWFKWLASQPNTDPYLQTPEGVDYYVQRALGKGGIGADNAAWWQNKATLAAFGGGVGAPDGSGGASASVDPSYLAPFTGTFSDAWKELYGSDFGPNMQPGNFEAPDPSKIGDDPGYKFRVGQAVGGLQNTAAAKGLLNSGGTLSNILGLEDQFAGQEYQGAWDRKFANWQQNWANFGGQFSRAWQQYAMDKDTFYQNESNPWLKLYQAAQLGAGAAGAGG